MDVQGAGTCRLLLVLQGLRPRGVQPCDGHHAGVHDDEPGLPGGGAGKTECAAVQVKGKAIEMLSGIGHGPFIEGDGDAVKKAATVAGEGLQRAADHAQIIEVEEVVVFVVDGSGPRTGLRAPIIDGVRTMNHVDGFAGVEGG